MHYKFSDGGKKATFPKTSLRSGDCVIRAITLATEQSYKKTWDEILDLSKELGDLPNSDKVATGYLNSLGWTEIKYPKAQLTRINSDSLKDDRDALKKMPNASDWVIYHIRKHWVACKDDTLFDIWDSRYNSIGDYSRVFRVYTKNG